MTDTITVPLSEATDAQLREFATNVLGLSIHHAEKGASMRSKIAAVWDKDTIAVSAAAAPVSSAQAIAKDKPAESDKIVVFIDKTEEAGGNDPVFVQVNGRAMYIPRGENAPIPRRYYEVLKNAVSTVYDQMKDGAIVPREVPRYPFRVVSAA